MPDDTLRIVARVEDQFTGPLGKLKGELKGVGDATARHGEAWRKDWGNARVEVEKFKGVLGGFSPILSGIGAGGFAAALSIGGMASALRQFSGSTQQLSMLSRETGVAVDRLRAFGALGERFGVSADAMKGAVSSFATTMFDLRRRWGEAYSSLQAMNLGKLAEDLVNAPDMDAALKKAMDGIQKIPEPEVRRRVSRMLFGTDDVARIANSLGEKMSDALAQVQREIGKLDKDTEKAAADFEKHLGRVGNAIERLKLGTLGPALKAIDRMIESGDQEGIRGNEQAVEKNLTTRRDRAQARIDYLRKHGDTDPNAQRKLERLTDEVAKLNEQLRLMREGGGAYQPMSFTGTGIGGGGGSLIQKAAWGGFGGGGGGGGFGGGFSGGGFGGGSGGGGSGGFGGGSEGAGGASRSGGGGGGSGGRGGGGGGGVSDDGAPAGQARGDADDARPWPAGPHASPRAPVPFREAFGHGPLGMREGPLASSDGPLSGGPAGRAGGLDDYSGPTTRAERMKGVYDAFRHAGFNHGAAKSFAAEIGRENGYQPHLLFGTHRDPANGALNGGMMSWQKARFTNLMGFMKERGLINQNGSIQRSQASLNAMADFARSEMENPRVLRNGARALRILGDPGSTHAQRALSLGDDVIQWAQHDPRYAHHKAYRDGYYRELGALTDSGKGASDAPTGAAGASDASGDMAFGDSIAHGIRQAGRLPGNTQPNISSKEVLRRILGTDPVAFKGKRVFLSSGLSNSPGDLGSVRKQIEAVRAAGGHPVLMGAGPRSDLNDANGRLRGLAGEAGVDFQELGQTSDGVHPNNYGRVLGQLRQKGLPQPQQEAGPTSAEGAGKALMKRLYQDAPIRRPGASGSPMASAGGKLDIHLHGFPQGARAKADMGGLFKETSITRGRAQMDMDRA